LPLASIRPDPAQPRKEFDWNKLRDLAASIRSNGQWVRVIVRPDPERSEGYVLIDGERRWRAMALVPSGEIDAEVVEGPLDAGQLLLVQTTLGLTGERLDPLELGESCQRLGAMYELTPQELAEKLGTTTGTLSKLNRIVQGIAEPLKADVKSGALPFTVAYHLARLPDAAEQVRIAELFKAGRLKRDSLADAVAAVLNGGKSKGKTKRCKLRDGDVSFDLPANATWEAIKTIAARLAKAAAQGEKTVGVSPALALPGILKSI
jgi:ParB family chromosome partitioning protein